MIILKNCFALRRYCYYVYESENNILYRSAGQTVRNSAFGGVGSRFLFADRILTHFVAGH